MSRLKVLIAESENFSEEAVEVLRTASSVCLYMGDERQGLINVIGDYDIVFTRLRYMFDAELFDAAKKIKFLVSPTTGLDHIHREEAQRRGVEILSLQGQIELLRNVTATAEHTWALLLALTRRLPEAIKHVSSGGWDRNALRGTELREKTIGIVGLGRLGSMVARYAVAFGMKVKYFDPFDPMVEFRGLERCSTLAELVSTSDIITLHLPLNDETKHLFNGELFKKFKRGSVLINTSRGAIVDTDSLIDSLEDGSLSAAALDVIDGELNGGDVLPERVRNYLACHDNLLITPHIGGATLESMTKTEVFMAEMVLQKIQEREN